MLTLPSGPDLPPETEQWIVDGLVEAMPGLRMRELFTQRRDMLAEADYVIAGVDRGRAVSLLTSRWAGLPSGRQCLHVMVQFVGDDHRGGALFGSSWAAHFARLLSDGRPFPEVIALKTYNPVVHCAMAAFGGHPEITLYPDLAGKDQSRTALAREVAHALAPGAPFDSELGLLGGIGRPVDLYRERPRSYLPETNAYFEAHAAPGDRVLCLLHVPTRAGADAILAALGVPLPSGRH
ncbi:hypothetical protein [Streptomyces sp. NPDC006879]|uniref:hypothetical protein n=1 Tax=Streptomyces sp. NPDC006879 TaxID=3364767 RepID=UPI0036C67EB8